MGQNLLELPKEAEINIKEWRLQIQNHKITTCHLFYWVSGLIIEGYMKKAIPELEGRGITYEVFVEECAKELDENPALLLHIIWFRYDIQENWKEMRRFTESDAGRIIPEMLINQVRECNSWEEFHKATKPKSVFQKNMKKRIKRELKEQQCLRV